MKLIRGLLFLFFSCIPGCGQMHQGYMKRGISQTLMFCGILSLTIFLEIGALAVMLAPLWAYSFFDSYNLRRQRLEGCGGRDAYLFGMSDLDSRRLTELFQKRHSLVGWTLVLLGLYILYTTVTKALLHLLYDLFPWNTSFFSSMHSLLVWDVPRIAGTLLIIALGVWFIRGPKRPSEDDSIPVFTPVQEEAAPVYTPEFFGEAPHAPDIPGGEAAPEQEVPHGDD